MWTLPSLWNLPIAKIFWAKKITDYRLYLYTSRDYVEKHKLNINDLEEIKKHPFAGFIPDILYTEQLDFNHFISDDLNETFQGIHRHVSIPVYC